MKIPIARTSLTEQEISSVLEPLQSGWLVQGPKVSEFESKWSNFTKSQHSIAVTSCTSALHLSLEALGFKAGDEAIVPAFTWISTANVVEHLGGKVVFCDVNLDTFNIDVNQIENKINNKTKAILPVHLFGLSADMDPIIQVAKKNNISIVEDAACGFGSMYKGEHVGTLGDTGCFSFHPRKSITTGEGGMVTCKSKNVEEKIRRLRDHGAEISDLQRHLGPRPYLLADHTDAGYNQRMTDLQAALGSAQMDRADDIIKERKRLASIYDQELSDIDWLQTPKVEDGYEHSYQSYPCIYKPEEARKGLIEEVCLSRNKWMDFLLSEGISTRPATHAVHMLSFYREKYNIEKDDFHNSYTLNNCSVSLPLFHGLTEEEQEYIIQTIKSTTKK